MESHGVRWCMHSGSALTSVMQTTGPVLMGSGPMSKEGKAGGERLTIYSFDPSLGKMSSSLKKMCGAA
jgi:hypothetical protein